MTEQRKQKYALPLITMATAVGAYLYRLRGGGPGPNLPRPVDQILFSSVPCILLPSYATYSGVGLDWWYTAISSVVAVAMECTGHGKWFDLGTTTKESEDERLEFIIKPLESKLTPYWYDVIGMGLTGIVVTILPGIVTAMNGFGMAGLLLALSGLLKPIGYMLAGAGNTEMGEYISGGLRWAAAMAIFIYLM